MPILSCHTSAYIMNPYVRTILFFHAVFHHIFNILCQLLLECLLVAAAAFCSAALVAAPLSQPLGDLLAGSVVDEAAGPFEKTFDRFQNVVLERVSSEPVTLLYPVEGGGLAAVGILLLSVSLGTVCIAAAPILRQKPRDILSGK